MRLLRFQKLLWIVGVMLLVGSLAGASWILNGSPTEPTQLDPDNPFDGESISALGYVDVPSGVARLLPQRGGRIVSLAEESDRLVKKGEVLLQLDDTIAKVKLKQAELALKLAEKSVADAELALQISKENLRKAKIAKQQHDALIRQQEAWLEAARKQKETSEEKWKKAVGLFQKKLLTPDDYKTAQDLFKRVAALAKAEEEKLNALKLEDPTIAIKQAELDIKLKENKVAEAKLDVDAKQRLIEEARQAVEQHRIVAPVDGYVLRVHVRLGEVIGPEMGRPAIEFCPNEERIIRAEVMQEWGSTVKEGQDCVIKDDTTSTGTRWYGKIVRVSDWYTRRRSIILEPFQFNDVRTLECIVSVKEVPGQRLRIGQRMRVYIHQGGP